MAHADLEWMDRAKCLQLDPRECDELFFPNTKGSKPGKALKFCSNCPVREQCINCPLFSGEYGGFMAGLTDKERRMVRGYKALSGLF